MTLISLIFISGNSFAQEWGNEQTNVNSNLYGVSFIDDTLGIATGENGEIIKTIDGGETWEQKSSLTTNNLNSVTFLNYSDVVAAGEDGTISKSTDSGETWASSTISGEDFNDIHFIDNDTGFVCGDNGEIRQTNDGGDNWQATQASGTTENLMGIFFLNSDTGFVTGTNGLILRTQDGGTTWNEMTYGEDNTLNDVYFTDNNTGIIIGTGGSASVVDPPYPIILRTTDAGNTWNTIEDSEVDTYFSVLFTDDSTGYAAGSEGLVSKTTDTGATWKTLSAPTNENLHDISFPEIHTGYISGNDGVLLKTCPNADFVSNMSNEICQNTTVNFTNQSKSANNFQWSINQDSVDNKKDLSYTFTDTGTHNVELIAYNSECSDTSEMSITVHALPQPAFQVDDECHGDTISFNNQTTIDGASIISYLWTLDDGDSSSAEEPNHYYDNAGTYNVTLRATSGKGCKDSITKDLELYPVPEAQFTHNDTCHGSTTHFENQTQIDYGSLSYDWDLGDGTQTSNENHTRTYNDPGLYETTLIATSGEGCSDTTSDNVNVHHVPEASFNASDVCDEEEVKFTNNSSVASAENLNYEWDFGDGNTSQEEEPEHLFSEDGTYEVTLEVITDEGCSDVTSESVTIHPNPQTDFTTEDVCRNQYAKFQNNSSGDTSINDFHWDFGDENTGTDENPEHKYDEEGTYSVGLEITDDRGCSDTTSDEITIKPVPEAVFTANNICQGDTMHFENLTSEIDGDHDYYWTFRDGDTSSQKNPDSRTYQDTGQFMVELVAEPENGCNDTTIQQVEVQKSPEASFTAKNVCLGDSVEFMNTSDPFTEKFEYRWILDEGDTSNEENPVQWYGEPGTYEVELSILAACNSSITETVEVLELPESDFTYDKEDPEVSFFPADTTHDSYDWDFGDGFSSSIMQPTHTYEEDGEFEVTLTTRDSNDCVQTSSDSVSIISTGITVNNIEGLNNFNLYPNPVYRESVIELTLAEQKSVSIDLYDLSGRKVSVVFNNNTLNSGEHKIPFNPRMLGIEEGLYLIQVKIDNEQYPVKVKVGTEK